MLAEFSCTVAKTFVLFLV